MMIGAQCWDRTVSGVWKATDPANAGRSISNSLLYSSNRVSFQLGFQRRRHFRKSKSILVCCRSSRGSFNGKSSHNSNEERDHEYLEAFILLSGEFAVERLIDSSTEDGSGDSPNHFQLVKNLVGNLGYEVKMVKITERVVNTYFARIFFCKPGEKDILSVDARPSDAINVANRCKAPIYVNKQIVMSDAIRIAYGMGRPRGAKCIYDVSLDSAADGPDLLTEELNLIKNLNLAVKEERYSDAAMLRKRLTRLLESRHEF